MQFILLIFRGIFFADLERRKGLQDDEMDAEQTPGVRRNPHFMEVNRTSRAAYQEREQLQGDGVNFHLHALYVKSSLYFHRR